MNPFVCVCVCVCVCVRMDLFVYIFACFYVFIWPVVPRLRTNHKYNVMCISTGSQSFI